MLQIMLPDLLLVTSLSIFSFTLFAPGCCLVSKSHLHFFSPPRGCFGISRLASAADLPDKSRNVRAAVEERASERNSLVPHGLV